MKQEEDSTTELRFPAGLRVLVVDDDNTCLKLMYALLRKCQYYVTTTNRAAEALRILKERQNSYDIVITDYEMPEIDGMKLLQLVGLETSIPVIMLSSYSDTKLVIQGIRNGACDYLVKPVRIQELQNIWQHVVRRNKSITLRRSPPLPVIEDGQRAPTENNTVDVRGKGIEESSRGRDDDEEEDDKDNSPTLKKPRLFWTVDLHQKFVDAVNSIGIEKAFPKKILDIMNVPGLTREKVASHLQKYRIYLRRIGNGSNQAASKISAYEDGPLGGGYGVYRSLSGGTPRFPGINPSLSHLPIPGQLNANSGFSIRGLASSPMLQTPQLPNNSTPFGKFEPATPSPNPNATTFQGYTSQQQKMASFLFPTQNSIMPNPNAPRKQSSSDMGAFDGTGGSSFNLLDSWCPTPNWGTTVYPQTFQPNNLFTSNISANGIAPPRVAPMQNVQNDPLSYLCGFSPADSLNGNLQSQNCLNGNSVSSFNYMGQPNIWQDHRPDSIPDSLISPVPPADRNLSQSNIDIVAPPFNPLEGTSSQFLHQNNAPPNMKFEDFLLEDPKPIASSSNGGSEYLEDIVGRFLKQDNGETAQAGDDFGLDPFSI